jgi:hypothetical protein
MNVVGRTTITPAEEIEKVQRLPGSDRPTTDVLSFSDPIVVETESSRCFENAVVSHYSLEVTADTPVRVAPGTQAQFNQDGAGYDIVLHSASREDHGTDERTRCGDVLYDDRIRVRADVRVQDPAPFIATLTTGVLPECRQGNADGWLLDFGSTKFRRALQSTPP